MGSRGPLPKRSTERAGHRTRAEQPDRVHLRTPVRVPPAHRSWHPQAKAWYRALARSGQARYFEPSDWELARLVCELLTRQLASGKPQAAVLQTIFAAMQRLGTTEADRRRMGIEVERPEAQAEEATEAKLAVLERYRKLAEQA